MEVFVGTSGWTYQWNPKRSLRWYVENSGFNAVELNASFYRFPTEKQVQNWSKVKLRWAVKVHRMITHVKRLTDLGVWERFRELFEPLNPDFFLFQMPPSFKFSEDNLRRVKEFASNVGERMAIEFRDPQWYTEDLGLDVTVVSIDSPIGVYMVNTSGTVYMRFHGRNQWYFYRYESKELQEVAERILNLSPKPERVYMFFNNDLWMLDNGREMMSLLTKA
ncbi:DUF72 domain-containing protein [Metallosphaera hakonensis JCM 8857 = DSM 7519]|uniref:DUF72 domain-containing protein n=1 Tax=Metallosphaera hakonensis JCM 8857 = DSM 7519 TaxID=1293036 RepID=A0A2U9IRJ6_9CREN|nr:DUF72 domain-containing protein [Metallosphaera hakonensis]AWR98597.1 DUF72 domain-containing protein [Metallosphaera hakonensis JCM 8857 = DSM 7519]